MDAHKPNGYSEQLEVEKLLHENAILKQALKALQKKTRQIADSEERFELVLDLALDGLWDWDLVTNEVYWSRAWCVSLGYEPFEIPASIATWETLLHPDDVAPTWKKIRDHVAGNSLYYECENRLLRKDGSYRWNLEIGKVVARDKNGKALRMVGADKDITAQKETEQLQKKLEETLRQKRTIRSVSSLAARISHEFSNMVTIALSQLELLKRTAQMAPRDKDVICETEGVLRHANEIAQRILVMNRKSQAARSYIEFNDMLEQSLRMIRPRLPSGVELSFKQNEQFNEYAFFANPTQFQQLIVNLYKNAVHAVTDKKHGCIEVNSVLLEIDDTPNLLVPELKKGRYACIQIKDNGCGMSQEIIHNIFDPFFTTKDFVEGAGMGLAVVYNIVQQYEGTIQVESEQGVGSMFSVYLPVVIRKDRIPSLTALHDEQSMQAPPLPLLFKGRKACVLYIDDESLLVAAVSKLLGLEGLQVEGFTDPYQALACFQEDPSRFDIVVTDQMMHGLTGSELICLLRQQNANIPVIMFSGGDLSKIEQNQSHTDARYAADLFLLKPITTADLAYSIRSVLHEKHVMQSAD